MSQTDSSKSLNEQEVDLQTLFKVVWNGKWIVIVTTFLFAVMGVFYALSLPNIYKSEALLAPVADDSGMNISGQLGGLAALAGFNLGSEGGDKTALTLEILKSREFIGQFIQKYDLFVPLMAAKDWNRDNNELIIDDNVYNSERREWVRKVKPPFKPKPSLLESYEKFQESMTLSQDSNTGMVTLSILHFSPVLAQEWTSLLIKEINVEMRNRELSEAQNSIDYLYKKIEETSVSDVKTMLFSLIEEQSKTVMLANVRSEYVLKTVDPAIVSETKEKPSRALICILAVAMGGMLSMMFVFVRYFAKRAK